MTAAGLCKGAAAILLLFGVLLRLREWWVGGAISGDEASLYVNLLAHDGARLAFGHLGAVPMTQAGPPGWLLATDWLAATFSPPGAVNERALRLWPMLASVLALPAVAAGAAVLARRAGVSVAAAVLLAAGGLAAGENVVAVQRLKPYTTDLLATAALLALALHLWRPAVAADKSIRRAVAVGVAAGVLGWFSQPMLLVAPAVLLIGGLTTAGVRWQRRLLAVAASGLVAGTMLLPTYAGATAQRDDRLEEWWREELSADAAGPVTRTVGLLYGWNRIAEYALPPAGAAVLLPFGLAGAWRLRRDPAALGVALAPAAALTVAALAGVYPMSASRVVMFALPTPFLLAGVGFAWCSTAPRAAVRLVAVAVAGAGLLIGAGRAFEEHWPAEPDALPAARAAAGSGLPVGVDHHAARSLLRIYHPDLPVHSIASTPLPAATLVEGGPDDWERAVEELPPGVAIDPRPIYRRRGRGRPAARARGGGRWRRGRVNADTIPVRPLLIGLVLLLLLIAPAAGQTRPVAELPPLPDPREVADGVPVPQLAAMLRPLTAAELEPVAANWIERLRDKAEQVARARVAARQIAEGPERDRVNRAAAALELQRAELRDRVDAVLDALDDRGGDVKAERQYVAAVTRTDLDVADLDALAEQARVWLLSPSGGVGVALNLLWFLLTLILALILAGLLRRITRRAVGRLGRASTLLKDFLAGLVAKLTLLIGVVVAISFLGVNVGPVLAAIGAAGLVVGLALQGTLSNFASGILILLYRPYDVGDVIDAAGGVGGKVEAMTLVSTTIVTFDNQRIVVPNNNIWGETITNLTALPIRRVDMTFGVSYGDDLDRVMEILADVVAEHPLCLAEPPPLIKVVGHGDSSVNVTCRPWASTGDYWTVYWDFHKLVKQRFDREGVSIPFPQRDVHLDRLPKAA